MTRALVTGGDGFVGRHLVAHLRAAGDDVDVVDRNSGGPDVTDRDAVRARFVASAPDVVYHLAAFTHVGESWYSPVDVVRVNVEGTLNVLDAARACEASRVLVVGSAEEYGLVAPGSGPVGEDAPLRPLTPYGASKVAAGYFALQAFLASGLEVVRTRTFNHTGPGQPDRFLVPALAARIARAEHTMADKIVVGNLDPIRDITDVRDVVRAYRMLARTGEAGAVYNVGSGAGIPVRDVAARLLAHASRTLALEVDPALVRPVEVPELVADVTRLRAATGWSPQYPLDRTLADLLDEARARAAQVS